MQPLTPNERRKIEEIKQAVSNTRCQSIYFETIDNEGDLVFVDTLAGKDLWLKVLSMAIAQNDAIEAEWRKR